MHPTIEEQLRGVERLLDIVEESTELSIASAESLVNARRLLTQVSRSWSSLPTFHDADNAAMIELLGRLGQLLPDLEGEISAAKEPRPSLLEAVEVAERNARLRSLLSRAIATLPRTDAGNSARAEIGSYLRRRVQTSPS